MASWTGKKVNVTYCKPNEPSFLKKFKEKVGYKEDHGLSDKFQDMPQATKDDLQDQGDELPQVVQLNPGDISQEEYKSILSTEDQSNIDENKEDSNYVTSDGKIAFRKPTTSKRKIEMNSSSKKKSSEEGEQKKIKKSEKEKKSNKKLLSFDDDDEL